MMGSEETIRDSYYRCGIVGPWHMGRDHIPQYGFEEFWSTYRYQGEHTPDRFDLDELYDLATDPGEMVNLIDQPACSDHLNLLKKRAREMLGETRPAGLYSWFLEPHH